MAADLVCLRDGREGEYLSELFRALGSVPGLRWDFAWLARVLDDSCAHSLLTASPRPAALRQSAGAAAYLDLVPYDQQLARFSKGFRRNLRKQRNHLQRLGPVEFVCVDSGPALDEAFEVFLDLEAAGWKGREGTAIRRLGPEAESFYREIARRLGRRSACEIYLLKAAGRVIGAQLCYLAADTCYMIKVAYDEHYEECSPGQTVIQHILERYGTRPPFSVVSFCSDEAWLRDLRPKAENVHELRVFNRTPGGTAARVLCRLKALAMGLGLRRRISGGNPLPPPPRQAPPEG
jgi:CelD/BcsL family acetyltransferase involved in cellulose biosynthesis